MAGVPDVYYLGADMGIIITLATTLILLLYFYYEDHNREPLRCLVEAFLIGAVISLQVSFLQGMLPFSSNILFAAFISAGLVEEGIKLGAVRITLFRHPEFTKQVDAITYCVYLGLGFAAVENLYYAASVELGIVRALTAVPAHALFAVSMGYYLGQYKFQPNDKVLLFLALYVPVMLHGIYNLLILSGTTWGMILFVPYVGFLWYIGLLKHSKLNREVKKHVARAKGMD